jgi:hypothetical protein
VIAARYDGARSRNSGAEERITMKVLLLAGGVLFLLLAVVLFIAAAIVFLMARKRASATATPAPQPQRPVVPPRAAQPPAPAAPTPAPPAAPHMAGTVVIDSHKLQGLGELHALSGPIAGRVFPIDPNGFYIGRDGTLSQVVIDSPSVSKRHLWIGVRDGAVIAIDQKSTNGTYLNRLGSRITEAKLNPGDTLILADDVARLAYRI